MVIGVGVRELLADRYQLQELLGRGAMGDVWQATDQLLGRPVAVKLLRTEEAADVDRFRLEAQTAARLNHPNVVGVYDFGSHHGRLYLVMELVDGWSLAQERSLRGTLPPHEAAAVAAQVATGLAAAHQQHVIHRDIKPANVMLTTDRTAKIADFGIARFADHAASTLTATGKIIGTADYLAPERALGRPAQPASDIYSLGCLLYQLLTARAPFSGATSLAVVQQHVGATPPPPDRLRPDIPKPLSDYVLHMLAKEPDHRPTAEQAADWLARRQRIPSPAHPDTPAAVLAPPTAPRVGEARGGNHSRPHRHHKLARRAVLYGTGLALFASAAALGVSLNSGDNTPSLPSTTTPASTTSAPIGPTLTDTTSPDTPSTDPITTLPLREHGEEDEKDQKEKDKNSNGKGKGRRSDD
ncbi:serine/threonine-protein kinase [Streptomyces sp. NPDC017936]|uniref:serine/threonine-protein kinase n=1 Tax=Streptomyces sp. NPDC017936 TaxID=3365016 RepID=UPI003798CE74